MRRFLLTSTKFTGQIELVYNEQSLISIIRFDNCNLPAAHLQKFLVIISVAVTVEAMPVQLKQYDHLTLIESDFEVTMDMFWNKYNKKINRKRCEQIWNKLTKSDQVKAYYGIDSYFKYLKAESWRTKLDPENYLRNRTWENEYK